MARDILENAPEKCYIMAYQMELDGKTTALDKALKRVFGNGSLLL